MKKVLILALVLIIGIFDTSVNALEEEIDYTETLESFENPERGFYQYFYYNFKVSENELPSGNKLKENLLHLRLGIGDFSKAVNGESDIEFSEDMLNMFSQILKTIKENGGTAIIRFSYDNFAGVKNQEPSLDMILKHISQLKPILEEYKNVISYIELGFFGPWGEMHSSDICTTDNVSNAIDMMLDTAPEKIKIGVRQPKYYAAWANIERSELNKNVTQEGTQSYRIGLYNDGYLGSESDLGTFKNREIEIQWLENQALHTLYGGEVVGNSGNGIPINTAKYMAKEAFRTHTTYLNKAYDKNVIESWKSEIYDGNDSLYKGQSGYTYINNHLGYRFVLRKSKITDYLEKSEKLNLSINIENVGFANLVNNKIVTLVLVKDNEKYEIKTDLDPTKWNSTENTNINFQIDLSQDIPLGEWKVYLRISQYGNIDNDNNYLCIRLANNNIWDEEMGANYIGKFRVVENQYVSDNKKKDNSLSNEKNIKIDKVNIEQKQDKENIKNDIVENELYKQNDKKIIQDKENVASDITLNSKKESNKFLIVVPLLIVGITISLVSFYKKK